MTTTDLDHLEQAVAALEAQRAVLGDAVVEAGLAPMRERLEALRRQSAAGQQRRRQVTVLFADISGFTVMSETTDAEDVTETINALWRLLDKVILDLGGLIDKHIGDAVMALWGVSDAREDDAERAVRAALEMQQALQTSGLQLNGAPLRMRIGLHTGPVFLSAVGLTGEYTAMGDTVNTSSRLQHVAPVGEVIISQSVYLQVRGIFDVRPLPPIYLEGKAEPLPAYVVKSARHRSFRMDTRGLEGLRTRMVGREADLNYLQTASAGLLQNGKHRMVTIVGEAGIGKSRLLYEFENWLELQPERFRYFKGRASPEMQSQPYALIRDLLADRFGIQESDPVIEMRHKMEQGLAESGLQPARRSNPAPATSNMRAHFIGQLLGYNFSDSPYLQGALDAQQLRDRALLYLTEFFQANAEARPTLVLLEDIHWADSRSLTVAGNLAQALPDQPLFIVCLTRPSLFDRHPQWTEAQPFHTRLTLDPLSRDDSRQLVAEILQKAHQVPEALRDLIVNGADGNPYYVEELIKMLIDDGVIVKEADYWHIQPDGVLKARVPPTLAGILQARLDSLSPLERTLLQQAAVVGRTFWDSALTYLAGPTVPPENLTEVLQTLCRRELIRDAQRKVSAFSGTREYLFKHALLRDVTYESVLKRDRRGYHARVAEWLIANSGERLGEFTSVIADHLELAGQTEQAARYLFQAGRLAAGQFANAEAIQYLSRALNLTPSATFMAERCAILLARERVYDLQGLRAEQTQDLKALEALVASSLDDETASRRAAIALRWSNYAEVTGNYPLAIASAQTAVEQARLAQDPAREAEGILLWGRALWRQGNLAEAMARNQQALTLAEANGFKPVQAQALRTIGAIAFHQGDYANVQAIYEQALALYQELGDRRGTGSALNNLGDIARQQGDYPRARDYFKQSIRTSREIGERWSEAITTGNLSLVTHNLGDQEAARDYAEQSLQLAGAIGSRSSEASARVNLAHALAALGDLAEATHLYQQAIDQRQVIGETANALEARAGLARMHLAQGHLAQAQEQVEMILDYLALGNTLDGANEPFRAYLTCYRVLRANNDPRAAQTLEMTYWRLQQQAARISDETLRRSFLKNVAAHANIVIAWHTRPAVPAPPAPRA